MKSLNQLGPRLPKFADSGKWTMVYSDQAKDPELLGRLSEVSGDFALPVHPTQLYDSLCGLFLFCVLIYVRHRKRFHGQVFVWWLLLYPVLRSTVEIFRGDHRERGMVYAFDTTGLNEALGLPIESHAFLSTSQFISLGMMSVALVILWRQRKSEGWMVHQLRATKAHSRRADRYSARRWSPGHPSTRPEQR